MSIDYKNSVFINCPFDKEYSSIFNAITFTIFDCGYIARSAREIEDSSEVRIDKIVKIISQCMFGIHDISRTELDEQSHLPRFNMPFELGIFLGAKRFGRGIQKEKKCIILDKIPHRYQQYISDISGQDIQAHNNEIATAVRIVREWLNSSSKDVILPGGKKILERYYHFTEKLPALCEKVGLTVDEMIFNDYTSFIYEWLKENPSFSKENDFS